MRNAARRTWRALTVTLTALLWSAAAPAQSRPDTVPSNNLQRETGKAGTFAYRLPGSYYGVSAFWKRGRSQDTDSFLRMLARMVMLRAAQLALDNDRQWFTIVGEIGTATTGARDVVLLGRAPSREPDQCGRVPSGQPYCIPGAEIPGTPDRISRDPGVFGRKAIVQIWTEAEAQQIRAGTMRDAPRGELLNAEAAYRVESAEAPGRWPSIFEIYEARAREGERILEREGPRAIAARTSAARAYTALGRLHAARGEMTAADAAWADAKVLIEEGLALEGVAPTARR